MEKKIVEQIKKVKEEFKKRIDEAKCVVVMDDNGMGVAGSKAEIMNMFTKGLSQLREDGHLSDKDIDRIAEISKMDADQLKKETEKQFEEIKNKLEKLIEKLGE